MTERPYLNFDVQIEGAGSAYRIRVLESPAGQAASDATLPFSDMEIENFILRLGRRSRGTRRLESRDLDGVREFGSKLFQATMSGDVGGAYRASLSWANREGAGLRIRLRLSDAPDLVDIPWEFLFDPLERRFVALSVDSPIVRFLDVPGTTKPFELVPPVRVLVIIASPSDFEPLQVEAEWARLKEAVSEIEARGQIVLERLSHPTLAELQRALRRDYHVLHFIGHGGFDATSQDGLLVFEDDKGRGSEVSATYLSTLLHDADSLRLAVLNACDGARSSRTDPFAGVAQSLLQQGVPAVVAMQFEITDDAAITFAREFYGAFADGYSIEASVGEARKSIFAGQNDSEWGTPVLYLRSIEGPIFRIAPLPPSSAIVQLVADPPQIVAKQPVADGEPITQVLRVAAPEDSGVGGPAVARERGPRWAGFGRRGKTVMSVAAAGTLAMVAILFFVNGNDDQRQPAPKPGPSEPASPTAVPAFASFSGIWYTNFARVELEESGGRVTGSYYPYLGDNRSASLVGDRTGNDLFGTFDGLVNKFAFTRANDANSFEGYWIDQDGGKHEWCGRRGTKSLQSGCGYSGEYKVRGLPGSLQLRGDSVVLAQTAGAAVLTFDSRLYGKVEVAAPFDKAVLGKAAGTVSVTASGTPVRFTIDWGVADGSGWDSLKGGWEALSPTPGGSGTWCAWRAPAPPPC
ncbi:MAG: CHAT domain-containing protein [Tepidiformaceae bacterium]